MLFKILENFNDLLSAPHKSIEVKKSLESNRCVSDTFEPATDQILLDLICNFQINFFLLWLNES